MCDCHNVMYLLLVFVCAFQTGIKKNGSIFKVEPWDSLNITMCCINGDDEYNMLMLWNTCRIINMNIC